MAGRNILFIQLIKSIIWCLRILSWAITLDIILSWILDPMHPVKGFLSKFVEPIIAPFRVLSDKLNTSGLPINFSHLFAYLALSIVIGFLNSLL